MSSWFWIPEPRPHARTRLYCFASAGAGAGAFARWGSAAPDGIEIVGIQLPGRESRLTEMPLRSLREIAAAVAPIIATGDARRFALFGHSAGARLATHVSLHLSHARHRPVHVFVSGSRWSMDKDETLHKLDSEKFFQRIDARYGAIPQELTADPEIRVLFERPLRADFEAIETDDLMPSRLPFPLTVITGSRDRVIDATRFAEWQAWSERPIVHEVVDADHFSYRTDPQAYMQVIARHLFNPSS
jgi:surfactin synthase thioesterase subunit